MSFFVVDVEADGPYPFDYSMVCFGAVKVIPELKQAPTFYRQIRPVSSKWIPNALAISGFTREQQLSFPHPGPAMKKFVEWVEENNTNGRPTLITDNPQFDGSWINAYCHRFVGRNPFGYSSRRIGDLFCGIRGNVYANWKEYRKTKHDHNPVNDALGNAEVILMMKEKMGLTISLC